MSLHTLVITGTSPDHDDYDYAIECPHEGDVRPCSLYFECEHTSEENTEAFNEGDGFAECVPGIPHEDISGFGICALAPGCGLVRSDYIGDAVGDILPIPVRDGRWPITYEFEEDAVYLAVQEEGT